MKSLLGFITAAMALTTGNAHAEELNFHRQRRKALKDGDYYAPRYGGGGFGGGGKAIVKQLTRFHPAACLPHETPEEHRKIRNARKRIRKLRRAA